MAKWKKGESGNRGGRPKADRDASAVVRRLLEETRKVTIGKKIVDLTCWELIVMQLIREATSTPPDHWAIRELANRGYGMPRQSMELSTPPGAGIRFIITGEPGGNGEGNGKGKGKVGGGGIRIIEGK